MFRRNFADVRLHIRGGLDGQLRDALRQTPLDLILTAIPDGMGEPDFSCTPLVIDEYQVIAGRLAQAADCERLVARTAAEFGGVATPASSQHRPTPMSKTRLKKCETASRA